MIFVFFSPSRQRPVLRTIGLRMTAAARSVLVVDDEEILLNLLTRVLQRAGCRVACARDGDEAVRLLEAEPEGFDVAILDLGVPPRGALTALRALRAVRPDIGAILTSGSGPGAEVREALREDGRSTFVGKPFAPADLTRALAQVSGEAP
jgi:CheY-like chemotaxis protein